MSVTQGYSAPALTHRAPLDTAHPAADHREIFLEIRPPLSPTIGGVGSSAEPLGQPAHQLIQPLNESSQEDPNGADDATTAGATLLRRIQREFNR